MDPEFIEQLRSQVSTIYGSVVAWRRDFHQHPELSGQEKRTSGIVAAHLRDLGLEVEENIGGYGVVGILRGKAGPGPTIGFRADMDALPLQEQTDFPYASQVPGVMHACGHDAHTAMLMGTAQVLASMQDHLRGTVKFIFQPAEESGGGSSEMIKARVLDNPKIDVLLGMHLLFNPAGTIAYKRNYALTASDSFRITITGAGGHGAKPHETNDVVLTACKTVENLHQIVSRKINPQNMAILSVGCIKSGAASNVLPTEATILGTVRTLQPEVQQLMMQGVKAAAQSACDFTGADFDLEYQKMNPAVHNDDEVMDHIVGVFNQLLGKERVIELTEPRCGSEDFSNYQQPGVKTGYFWLGGAYPGEVNPSTNHQPKYNWDEKTMETGVLASCAAICSYLSSEKNGDD